MQKYLEDNIISQQQQCVQHNTQAHAISQAWDLKASYFVLEATFTLSPKHSLL